MLYMRSTVILAQLWSAVFLSVVHAFAPTAHVGPRHSMLSYTPDVSDAFQQYSISTGDDARREWIDSSLNYYNKVMREERRRNLGQVTEQEYQSEEYNDAFLQLAKKHYFALRKIKDGKLQHAETIYRRIINQLLHDEEEDECDHAKLAVTTLLLALLLQRSGDAKKTRAVFLNFFRVIVAQQEPGHKCACTAKVLQAFALFEMKQGNELKSLDIALKAVKLDPTLRPVLNWKQFRDVMDRRKRKWKARARRQRAFSRSIS